MHLWRVLDALVWPCRLSVRDVSTGREQIYYPAADIDLSCKLSDLQPGASYELKVGSAAKQLQSAPLLPVQSLHLSILTCTWVLALALTLLLCC